MPAGHRCSHISSTVPDGFNQLYPARSSASSPLCFTSKMEDSELCSQHSSSSNCGTRVVPLTADPPPGGELRRKSKIQKQEEILGRLPPPPHWRAPRRSERLRQIVFNVLCMTSFGHAGLDPIWEAIRLEEEGDDSVWADGIRQTCDRLNNMLVMASLLLATSAVFITTSPPRETTINYTLRGPYICMLGSFGLLLGGIIVASVCVLVSGKARPYWSEQVLYANRFHVYCTIIMLSYPFFSIGAASLLLAFGALSAVWCAEDPGVQAAAPLLLVLPISMAVLFGVSCATAAAKTRLRKEPSVCSDTQR
ncbi:hypothetical protein C8R43DRAFT_1008932 [Mycena crocata]|nr:hypothetical protein C8R43DRAFT_1008932 [Mycena crocata]